MGRCEAPFSLGSLVYQGLTVWTVGGVCGSPRAGPLKLERKGSFLLGDGRSLGRLAACVLGSLGPRVPGGEEAGWAGLGVSWPSWACGSFQEIPQNLFRGEKAREEWAFGRSRWLGGRRGWFSSEPDPEMTLPDATLRLQAPVCPSPWHPYTTPSSPPPPCCPFPAWAALGPSLPPVRVHRGPHVSVCPSASGRPVGRVETGSGSEQKHPHPTPLGLGPCSPERQDQTPGKPGQEGLGWTL